MAGVFVTGTDTGVGKTSISAGLLKLLHGSRKVCYWKPVQTGTIMGDDTKDVRALTALGADCFMEPGYRFAEPLSPHMAAKKWNRPVELDHLCKLYEERSAQGEFVIVEGAGGLLVPLNDTELQIDLIKRLKLPLLIVAEDRVGAINHTLLTVDLCRDEKLPLHGVVLTRSRRTFGNAESIQHFGKIEILAEFDPAEDLRTLVGRVGANQRLRDLFQVKSLPD